MLGGKKKDLILTERDPFPGLYDGSAMHKDNTALVPRVAGDFTAGMTVAVEATVATYDFISNDWVHTVGYIFVGTQRSFLAQRTS
jgi:hypothetical protein